MYNCLTTFPNLVDAVYEANNTITDNITDLIGPKAIKRNLVCVRSNVEQEFFSKYVNKEWTKIVNTMVTESPCALGYFSTIMHGIDISKKINTQPLQDVLTEEVTDYAVNKLTGNTQTFEFSDDFLTTISSLLVNYADNCGCDIYNLFKVIVVNYSGKYRLKYVGKSKEEARTILMEDFKNFNAYIQDLLSNMQQIQISDITPNSETLTSYLNPGNVTNLLSIKKQLDGLIPDVLGEMKKFFATLISSYYAHIHPVIWCQIFAKMCDNFFIQMPITQNEFYQYVSNQLLLNSGPVILKILQMMRPLLDAETQKKYNLNRLTYPLLSDAQVQMILKKILYDIYDYKIIANLSASVGHVVLLKKVDQADPIIVKIIKPLSIVQSCAEYNMLKNVYEKGTCEQKFIDNMIYAIGNELDANNEIRNINDGFKYYTCDYEHVYEFNTGHKLTTLEVIKDIIVPDCWYAIAVTLAKGMPLSKLVENNTIDGDTKFRASLHRCLDLLVYKFFFVLLSKGFYHGDLHAGNIFFSFKAKTMTLIDFGAVGNLNLFANEENVNILFEIIIMSIFYNYEDLMDLLTKYLNTHCNLENNIDTEDTKYIELREELVNYGKESIELQIENDKKYTNNINKIFSQKRIDEEAYEINEEQKVGGRKEGEENIYSYLDLLPHKPETVIENSEELRNMRLEDSETKTLNQIIEILFKFYATNGVNVAVKFSDLYEFQKAYTLLLGVLFQTKYNFFRMNYAIKQAIMNCEHLSKIFHVTKVIQISKMYLREKAIYEKKVIMYRS